MVDLYGSNEVRFSQFYLSLIMSPFSVGTEQGSGDKILT